MKDLPKTWYAIAHITEISKKPTKFERLGKNIVTWRDVDNNIIVMDNRCPHRGVELSAGKICDNAIQCPFHGFEFDSDGSCKYTPETQGPIPKLQVKTYPSRVVAMQ